MLLETEREGTLFHIPPASDAQTTKPAPKRDRRVEDAASKDRLARDLAHLRELRDSGELGEQLIQAAQALILCGLPYRPTKARELTRHARLADGSILSVTFGVIGENAVMPYGADRTLLHWLIDKAIKCKSPIVQWSTASQYLKDVGINDNGKNRKDLKDRYFRLRNLAIQISRRGESSDRALSVFLIEESSIPGDEKPPGDHKGTQILKDGKPTYGFRLGDRFFREVLKNHVPVPLELLTALRHRSQMQDTALFLYWRSFAAEERTLITWESLRRQLWQDDNRTSRIRERFRDTIRALKVVWPELDAEAESSGLRIAPPAKHLLQKANDVRRLSKLASSPD